MTPRAVRIERVAVDRWEDVRRTRLRALADAPDAFLSRLADEQAMTDDAWRARLARTDAATFLAGDDGTAGMATAVRSAHVPDAVELVGMWTAPEHRRTGVGVALVDAIVECASEWGAALVLLDVATGNDGALAFYERCGFAPTDDETLQAGKAIACDARLIRTLG